MSCRTCCKTFVLVLLALAIVAVPAFAQNCLQDQATAAGIGSLVCTANDVQLAAVKNVQVIGGVGNKCLAGTKFSFLADFEVVTTSNKTRSNIGIYFGTAQNNAVSGTGSNAIISPPHQCPADAALTCGSDHYDEFDPSPDNCGDTSSTDTSPTYPGVAGAQGVTLEVDNVTCPTSGDTLSLPECTSWQVPGKQLFCQSPSPTFPYQPSAVPGSPSKCVCGVLAVPVQPITPSATVAKSCNTTLSTGANLTSCDEGAGDLNNNVTYHVLITNSTPAGEGGDVIDQICDNLYGTIYRSASFTGSACPAGSIGSNGSLISGCTPSPTDVSNGGTGTCDFTAHQNESLKEVDTVTVQGHSDISTTATFGPTSSNTVTVTSEESPSTSSTTKGLVGTEAACATVRFSVDVHNSSAADEVLSLSALNDSVYGDITKVAGNLLGTTCGVAVGNPGLGTFSGINASSTNGGSLPFSLTVGGNDYQCQFDGSFCGKINPAAEEFGTGACGGNGFCSAGQPSSKTCSKNSDCDLTCPGITQTDTVSSTITGDETSAPLDTVTQTITGLNVTECVQSFTSAH